MAMGPMMGIGGVDMLIPPSALTVLLGSLAGISIAGLLIGGIVPGLILSLMYGRLYHCARKRQPRIGAPMNPGCGRALRGSRAGCPSQ